MNIGIIMFVIGIIGMAVSFALIIWSYFSNTVNGKKVSGQANVNKKRKSRKTRTNKIEKKEKVKKSNDDTTILGADDTFILEENDTMILSNNGSDDTQIL